jgi:hypothetical protein
MKRTNVVVAFLLMVTAFLSLLYSQAAPKIEGDWEVKGSNYAGTMKISHDRGNYKVYGSVPEKFNADAKFDGKTLTFSRSKREDPGLIWSILSMFGIKKEGKLVTTEHSYTLGGDGKTFEGGWKDSKGKSGKESLKKVVKTPEITAIEPAEIEVSEKDVTVKIKGKNLPEKSFLNLSDFWFNYDSSGGPAITALPGGIKLKEILEVSDDGTQITAKISMEKTAPEGKLALKLKETNGSASLTLVRPVTLLPLGQSKEIVGQWAKVFVPIENGNLSFSGAEISELREGSKTGTLVKKEGSAYKIAKAGYDFIQLKDVSSKISNTYTLAAETAPAKTPWTFWYFPFYDRPSNEQNLYDDGGVYEKLDRILGVKGKEDGWKSFDPTRHYDWDEKDSFLRKLADKYYKNGTWTEPTDAADKEKLKKHNPTTIKGFAWCYQRTEDNNKSWWGHCWGAVVASSLYAQPKEVKGKDADGKEISFSVEEVEGVLTSFHTNHSIFPTNYMNRCPSGRPSDKKDEPWDSYIDDFFLGLLEGIGKQGLPLASDLRAEGTDEKRKDEIWNHVIYKYEAKLKQAKDTEDPTVIMIELQVWASDDRFPSTDSSRRSEDYTFVLKFNENGGVDRDNKKFQNWISAKHYTPSYLWRIQRSTGDDGTENEVVRSCFSKMNKFFDFKQIK